MHLHSPSLFIRATGQSWEFQAMLVLPHASAVRPQPLHLHLHLRCWPGLQRRLGPHLAHRTSACESLPTRPGGLEAVLSQMSAENTLLPIPYAHYLLFQSLLL